MELVLDTNVLVSALLHPDRPIARIAVAIGRGRVVPVYDQRILDEYTEVLDRPRLARKFATGEAARLITSIRLLGIDAHAVARCTADLPDEKDRPLVEVALATGTLLVTGNARHYPPRLGVQLIAAAELVRRLDE